MLIKSKDAAQSRGAVRESRNLTVEETEPLNAVKFEVIDGDIVETATGRCYPTPVQKLVAESLLRLLNVHIAHNGSWRCVWRDPPKKTSTWDHNSKMFLPAMPTVLQCQYLDKDGDPWCVVNIEEDTQDIIKAGISSWVEQCEEAYQFIYNMRRHVVDIREGKDTVKLAKGQAATAITNPDHMPYPTRL